MTSDRRAVLSFRSSSLLPARLRIHYGRLRAPNCGSSTAGWGPCLPSLQSRVDCLLVATSLRLCPPTLLYSSASSSSPCSNSWFLSPTAYADRSKLAPDPEPVKKVRQKKSASTDGTQESMSVVLLYCVVLLPYMLTLLVSLQSRNDANRVLVAKEHMQELAVQRSQEGMAGAKMSGTGKTFYDVEPPPSSRA